MSEHLHLDADSLNAFAEGVLPEHERAQCLAHLAECTRCRDIVFLAQDVPVSPRAPIPVPISARRRWLHPMPLLAAAAAVCVAILGSWLYSRSRTRAQPRELAAQVTLAPSLPPPDKQLETPASTPVIRKANPSARRRSQQEPPVQSPPAPPVTLPEPPRVAPISPPIEPGNSTTTQPDTPPPPKPGVVVQPEVVAAATSSGISGTVTDPSGAAVPRATVELRQLAGNTATNTLTDPSGQFKFNGLAPGPYELQITVPGFRRTMQRVEVQPQLMAAVKTQLEIGSMAESVTVTATAPMLQTESGAVSTQSRRKQAAPQEPRPLPSKLSAEIQVTSGKVMLAVDSAGTLFFSGNSGKSWKAVKSQWIGKVVRLVTPPEVPQASKAQFQLTTDSGSIWLSLDGRRWYSAPPQH